MNDHKEEEWQKDIITPRCATGVVVESFDRKKVLLVDRKYPPLGHSFPGGMMDLWETVEECAIREIREETGIDISIITLLTVLSDPKFDPRWHCVAMYMVGRAKEDKDPVAADDALKAWWVPWDSEDDKMIVSAKSVLRDYKKWRNGELAMSTIR